MATKSRPRPPHRRPSGYDADAFPRFAVTVDAVVLTIVGEQLQVVLIQRDQAPYEGTWALPGGFKRPDETLDEAAARELREEAGLDAAGQLVQLAAYGDPGRDPRLNVVTVTYRAVLPNVGDLAAATDARAAKLWPVDTILAGQLAVAFDHERILREAVDRTRIDLEATDLATAFVGPTFTLSQLRTVFEAVWGTRLDPANFRRTLLTGDAEYVVPTGELARPGPEGGRPAELYRARELAWLAGAPLRRPEKQARRQANQKLFNRIRALRTADRLDEALALCPPHWTAERAAILSSMGR